MKQKLLIATTNKGKFREIQEFLQTLPFEMVSLLDVGITEEPHEPFDSEVMNAFVKAQFYGEKSGLLTLSDDGGIHIKALNGWPGAKAKDVADNPEKRVEIMLEKMNGITNREAEMRGAMVVYDPKTKDFFTATSSVSLEIAHQPSENKHGFGFDPILVYPPAHKTFGQMTSTEKSTISHRGKNLNKIQYFLKKQYGPRHIVVPCGLLVQNGKLFMQKRSDPFRPDFHGKWEFPGGGVELGETMEQSLVREVQEETGYAVEVVHLLQHIAVEYEVNVDFPYQVYLVPYVCKIVGGEEKFSDQEVLETQWFELDTVTDYELLGTNKEFFMQFRSDLEAVIKKHNL